jgi:hypothetical protein
MFAEIHKKIPKLERLEDLLTSSFFNPLRYTSSFEAVLKRILKGVAFSDEIHQENFTQSLEKIGDDWEICFWQKLKQKEIDLLIISKSNKVIIGIEIKYQSELSGNEQLSNYSKLLEKKYVEYDRFLVFLAKDISAKKLYDETYKGVINADKNIKGFGYVSWQNFYRELQKIKTDTLPDKLIINDLLQYLEFKNLNGFIKFNLADLNQSKINPNQKYKFN